MTDSMGPGKLFRHMQNPSYTYDEYLICNGLGPSILSVIRKNLSYSGPSYPSSPVSCKCTKVCGTIYLSFAIKYLRLEINIHTSLTCKIDHLPTNVDVYFIGFSIYILPPSFQRCTEYHNINFDRHFFRGGGLQF